MNYSHQELRQILTLLQSDDINNITLALTLPLESAFDPRLAFMVEHWLSTQYVHKEYGKMRELVNIFFDQTAPKEATRQQFKNACSLFRPFEKEYLQKKHKARQMQMGAMQQRYIKIKKPTISYEEYATKQILSYLNEFIDLLDIYKELLSVHPTHYINSLETALYPRLQFLEVAPFIDLLHHLVTFEKQYTINPTTYFYLGEYYFNQFDHENAQLYFQKYIDHQPYHFPPQTDSRFSMRSRRGYNLPSTTEALTYLGQLAFYLEEDHDKAIHYFRHAIDLEKEYYQAPYIPLAEVYLDKGYYNQARETALKRLEKVKIDESLTHYEKKQFAHFLVNLGNYCIRKENDGEEALLFYKAARKIDADNIRVIQAQLDLMIDIYKDYWQADDLCKQLQKTNADPKLVMTYKQLIKKGRGY